MSVSAGKEMSNLGTRQAFNQTLRHLVNVTSLVDQIGKGANPADLLNGLLEQELIQREQVTPIVSVVHSKYDLPFRTLNLGETRTDFAAVAETVQKWNAISLFLIYHQPNIGPVPINPANAEHWEAVHDLKKDELLVIYARHSEDKRDIADQAIESLLKLLHGETPQENPAFIDQRKLQQERARQEAEARARAAAEQRAAQQASAQQAPQPGPAASGPAPSGGKADMKGKRLTPKYSVQVTNELFHNGNVEAWKNIIEAYTEKHQDCKVIVYHEGELIQDLNTLFKWGKVKHGGLIFFQVAGQNIKNVSRLQKYLHEGASSRFEAFMKHDVNKVLNLF